MENPIWITYCPKISTAEKPQHENCPPDEGTWCPYQKSDISGALDFYEHTN